MSGFQTPQTDAEGMFWPQVVRGLAIMFRSLPPTRLALGDLSDDRVPDASGLFNLMRNLGGAIGLALIDTVIYARGPMHGADLLARLQAGDADAARFLGIPAEVIAAMPAGPMNGAVMAQLAPLLQKAALTAAINEAWLMIGLLTIVALLCVPFARAKPVNGAPVAAGTDRVQ